MTLRPSLDMEGTLKPIIQSSNCSDRTGINSFVQSRVIYSSLSACRVLDATRQAAFLSYCQVDSSNGGMEAKRFVFWITHQHVLQHCLNPKGVPRSIRFTADCSYYT